VTRSHLRESDVKRAARH